MVLRMKCKRRLAIVVIIVHGTKHMMKNKKSKNETGSIYLLIKADSFHFIHRIIMKRHGMKLYELVRYLIVKQSLADVQATEGI